MVLWILSFCTVFYEADESYYQTSITKKAVSIAAYEATGILK